MPLPDEATADNTRELTPEEQAGLDAQREAQTREQERAQRQAELDAHPHSQLNKILRDLRAPGNQDINARVALALGAVGRLTQVILSHTPAPEQPEDADGKVG